jgi:prepilin peptidase CpaA
MSWAIEVGHVIVGTLFCIVLGMAAFNDIMRRRIPNWTVLAIGALFIGWFLTQPSVAVVASMEAALIVFLVSCAFYALGILGAGDSKLMTVVALFVGLSRLPQFALATGLVGGLMAIISLATEPTRALVLMQTHGKGDIGRGIPYGVAIALGGAFTVFYPFAS